MTVLFLLSAALQSVLILIDEFFFHWNRGLPRWERLGHPVDTFSLLLPLGLAAFFEPGEFTQSVYLGLAVLSCLCVTKDEWVHRELAPAAEHWVHAALFVLHPLVLVGGFYVWMVEPFWIRIVVMPMAGFLLYQILFWNFYADRFFAKRP